MPQASVQGVDPMANAVGQDDLATWGALDFLPAEQREQVVRAIRDESTRVDERVVWGGGGGLLLGRIGGANE
jgi:hypothetical protein